MTEEIVVVAPRQPSLALHSLPMSWLLYSLLACLITDLVYWRTAVMMWADFSAWFITIASVLAGLTVLAAIFDAVTHRLARNGAWIAVIGSIVAFVLTVLDAMVHTRDAWTSVVPWGIALSAIAFLAALITCVWTWTARRQEV